MADLADPLPYDDNSFDVACASLVLHYLRDWVPPLKEIRRVLRPGGRLIASVNHPLAYAITEGTYFGIKQYEFNYSFAGQEALRLVSLHEPPVADDTPQDCCHPPAAVASSASCSSSWRTRAPADEAFLSALPQP